MRIRRVRLTRFSAIEPQLPGLLDRLLSCSPYRAGVRPAVPKVPGVYLFSIAKHNARAAGIALAGNRQAVSVDQRFARLFSDAKAQVRAMDFRFVELRDPATSTIFEVYAALALGTEGEFNLFETH